ncbi:putative transcription factor interactor and regulator CCHC(Zn) family [Helianthus annuus]|nr:putative transcription factor interactor and regulator CCHC(Zn) family [Helianthus annuus]KAJ0750329.1 putative transcription factor interactor and regulator CCHC(Zn) family [Helianthus annuus]
MTNLDCQAYLTNFNTLSRLVPYLVTPEPKRIARFIGGLAPEIKASVKASRPATFRSAADLSLSLTLDVVRNMAAKASEDGKRKREDENSHRSDKKNFGFKRDSQQSVEKTKCETCRKYHLGKCRFESQPLPCGICKSQEHKTMDGKKLKDATCYGCNEKGHIKTNCPRNQKKPEEAKRTNA